VGVPPLSHPSLRCVVELRTQGPDQKPGIGTGYLVADGWVLTAAHVVRGMTTVRAWVNPQVALRVDEEARVDVDGIRYPPGDLDWALVPLVDHQPPEGFVPVVLATLDRDSAEPVPVTALGMPWFKLREPLRPYGQQAEPLPDGLVREVAAVAGDILPMGNEKTGTFTVTIPGAPETAAQPHARDSATGTTDDGGNSEPDEPRSVWAGMSGAGVWATGRLVGVVATHHPTEGAGTLTIHGVPDAGESDAAGDRGSKATTDDASGTDPDQAWSSGLPNLGQPAAITSAAVRVAAIYEEVSADLAPALLSGRGDELAELDEFATSTERWRWYCAEAFAGKSALLAWWTAHHQLPDTIVVGCFLRRTATEQNTAKHVVNTLSVQLGAVAGLPDAELRQLRLLQVADLAGLAELRRLLKTAAPLCPGRLVLVVDGLDESATVREVKEWLPDARALPANAALLVSSRTGAPAGIPNGHPLHDHRHTLAPSPVAARLRALAEDEIEEALQDPGGLDHRVLAFLAAADGPLTHADLAHLIRSHTPGVEAADIQTVWQRQLARTLTPDTGGHGIGFSHDALREYARDRFADELSDRRNDLHAWAQDFAELGWPDDTPRYLLNSYSTMITAERDIVRLVALSTDRHRQTRLREDTGGDARALTDLAAAFQLLVSAYDHPGTIPTDLRSVARVVWHRDLLRRSNADTPVELPSVWASLGEYDRAERLAGAIPQASRRAHAFTTLTLEFARLKQFSRAAVVADKAERAAATITVPDRRDRALAKLAGALTYIEKLREAERVADTIAGDKLRSKSLVRVALELARNKQSADVRRVVSSVTDRVDRTRLLVRLATALAEDGALERAALMLDDAEQLMSGSDPQERMILLVTLARAWADRGALQRAATLLHEAEQLIDKSERHRSFGQLLELAGAWADQGALELAATLLDEAQQLMNGYGLLTYSKACAHAGMLERAVAVLYEADSEARGIVVFRDRARAQIAVVTAMADIGEEQRALALAEEAARFIAGIPVEPWRIEAAEELVNAAVQAHGYEFADGIASSIADPSAYVRAKCLVAGALMQAGEKPWAVAVAGDAERAATLTDHPYPDARIEGLNMVSTTWVSCRENARAVAVTTLAKGLAGSIESPKARAKTLVAIAVGFSQADDLEAALAAAEDAEHLVRNNGDGSGRDSLVDISKTLADANEFSEAKRTARLVTDSGSRADALAHLARGIARSGDLGRAEVLAREVEHLCSEIGYMSRTVQAKIAVTFAAAHMFEAAERVVQSLETDYDYDGHYTEALRALTEALLEAGLDDKAERVAKSPKDESTMARVLADLAVRLVHAMRYRKAERIATHIYGLRDILPEHRDAALARVASALAQAQRYSTAWRVAACITPGRQHVRATAELAAVLAQAGHSALGAGMARKAYRLREWESREQRALVWAELSFVLAKTNEVAMATYAAERAAESADYVEWYGIGADIDTLSDDLCLLPAGLARIGEPRRASVIAALVAERFVATPGHRLPIWSFEQMITALIEIKAYGVVENIVATITDSAAIVRDSTPHGAALCAIARALGEAGEVSRASRLIITAWDMAGWEISTHALSVVNPDALVVLAQEEMTLSRGSSH